MNQQDQHQPSANADRREAREHFWKTVVVPTAKGLEHFFWNLAWFAVIVMLLFGGTCISRSAHQENQQETQSIDSSR